MTTPPIQIISQEELKSLLKKSSPEDLQAIFLKLSDIQIKYSITLLESHPAKLLNIIQILNSPKALEAVGEALSANQFLTILSDFSKEQSPHPKLLPLLVGLPFPIFFKSLFSINKIELDLLKKEGLLEPLEHHLNALIYEIEKILAEYIQKNEDFSNEIINLPFEDLGYEDIEYLESKINSLKHQFQTFLSIIDKGLSIVWSTDRIDLIEKMSHHKELAVLQYHSYTDTQSLFNPLAKLLHRLDSIYSGDPHPLNDNEASIEALTRLSLWYLNDYWEMGLLPEIKKKSQLAPDLDKNGAQKKLKDEKEIYNTVKNNLKQLGLETLQDLKQNRIYSKKTLQEFIRLHQDRLC